MGSVLEIFMLLCFAASWPFNIRKSWKCRTAVGKSIVFELLIECGYFCGIAAKFVRGEVNYVLVFYVLDICLVGTDMALYFRNRKLDAERALSQQ